jgi:hypothetical protein
VGDANVRLSEYTTDNQTFTVVLSLTDSCICMLRRYHTLTPADKHWILQEPAMLPISVPRV